MVIIYTVAGASGFALSSFAWAFLPNLIILRGSDFTVGASAAIFGLLGALVYYGRRSGSSVVHGQAMTYVLVLGFFGFVMPGVDNYAHIGGFGGGYLAGRVLDPLKPERTDHMIIALLCLGVSLAAIVASVVHGVQFL
jgi:rhomboid protease GluP